MSTAISAGGAQKLPAGDGRRQGKVRSGEPTVVPGLLSGFPGTAGLKHLKEGVWDLGLRSVFPLRWLHRDGEAEPSLKGNGLIGSKGWLYWRGESLPWES